MNLEIIDAPRNSDPSGKTPEQLDSLRQLTLVAYILYALSFFTGISAIVAVVVNYVKRDDVQGTLYESHFTWQIRTFWWGLGWTILGVLTLVIVVGFPILLVAGIWWIYRIVKGLLNWHDNKPMKV